MDVGKSLTVKLKLRMSAGVSRSTTSLTMSAGKDPTAAVAKAEPWVDERAERGSWKSVLRLRLRLSLVKPWRIASAFRALSIEKRLRRVDNTN
jgi:hypothetical protein